MNINYYHKNIDSLGSASRDYIEEKIGSVESLTSILSVHVEIDQLNNSQFHMAVDMKSKNGDFRAEETAQTVQACVDAIEEELKRQVRHSKEKERTLMKRGGRSIKKKTVIDDAARF